MSNQFKGINTIKAKAEFRARKRMQEEHIDKTFGASRLEAERLANGGVNYALKNFIYTIHSFKHIDPTDNLAVMNYFYKLLMVHVHGLENKAMLMADALGEDNLKELDIDRDTLVPTEYATKALQEIASKARERAKLNKYDTKQDIIT